MSDEPTREVEAAIEIDASPAAVWKALTDAEELSRWFCFEARTEPGPGGSIWLSWGEGCQGTGAIEVWEPERRLRVRDQAPEGAALSPLATDYLLAGRGGKTVLRVVSSGFGRGADWDEQYDSISRGWEVFLRALAYYFERHLGTPRQVAYAEARFAGALDDAWSRLLGPRGLAREGAVDGLREGGDYRLTTADGDRLAGTVQVFNPPKDLAVTVAGWNDAHLWLEVTPEGGANVAKLTLSTYGVPQGVVRLVEQRWQAMLDQLFPAAAEGTATA